MQLQQITASIEELIGRGELEQALDRLVAALDTDPRYADLAKTVRLNQGELYQIKAQQLKGTIATDEFQLAYNKIADRSLEIIKNIEQGRFALADSSEPTPRQAWRYYVVGGIVTLAAALLIWRFLSNSAAECPRYEKNTKYRVLILPFRQTGENKTGEPAIEIADGLNVLISRTPNLKDIAAAEVKENYTDGYPSPQLAAELAQQCDAQMIVWGKINQSGAESYKLDIRYRLLDAGKVYGSGDTSLNNLLRNKDQGQLIRDIGSVTEMLYIVLANKAKVPVNNSLFAALAPASTPATDTSLAKPDTSMLLLLAANVYRQNPKEAVKLYDQVIATYPDNVEARQKRGALLYQQGDYAGAVRDFDFAAPDAEKATPDLLKYRTEAALQSGQPVKAESDLNVLSKRKDDVADAKWLSEKRHAVEDSIAKLRMYRDKMEKEVQTQPSNTKVRIDAAKANIKLGDPDRSLQLLGTPKTRSTPKSAPEAEIAIEAHLLKRDTVSARKVLENAERAGLDVKGVSDRVGVAVKPLKTEPVQKTQAPQKRQ